MTLNQLIIVLEALGLLALGWYTAYKQWLQRPKITLDIGDAVELVRSSDGQVRKIHLACSLSNEANKLGTVTKIVIVLFDGASEYLFNWQQFYEYRGAYETRSVSQPCPIPVPGRDSVFQGIEFLTEVPLRVHEGTYKFVVLAWLGRNLVDSEPFSINEYEFTLNSSQRSDLDPSNQPGKLFSVWVPLLGTQPSLEDVRKYLDC